MQKIDFSEYSTVFCDSIQALEHAYENGLPESAIIKTSSPALLWARNKNAHNIEARWTSSEIARFQNTIKELTKNIFNSVLKIDGVERELALNISHSFLQFQKVLYKAACLNDDDFIHPRLFIYASGKTGPAVNIMNSPWDKLLSSNPLFVKFKYSLKNDDWDVLSTHGVSYWSRFKVAGPKTIIYRLAIKIMKNLPDWIFKREIIMPNENELNIEIASELALHGVRISNIQLKSSSNTRDTVYENDIEKIYETVGPIMRKRVIEWVAPSAIEIVMSLFKLHLEMKIKQFNSLVSIWNSSIVKSDKIRYAVLMNAPGGVKGHALSFVCRKKNIPLISSQHGVTVEISKAHSMLQVGFDNSVADVMFDYNFKIAEVEKKTCFNKSEHHIVGMPLRITNMRCNKTKSKIVSPIVYISTNLYHMGFNLSQRTDYSRSLYEKDLITEVLGKLPHKVRYKTYPEDNRRYVDVDPVLSLVESSKNMELFANKIDMRYLISEHKIFVTTCATSTLSWPVISRKPVVFINQKYNSPLTDDALKSLSKGLFVFNDDSDNFLSDLRDFLSQPIDKIEELWKEKKFFRENMIRNYFSEYSAGAGKRAAHIILKEYM